MKLQYLTTETRLGLFVLFPRSSPAIWISFLALQSESAFWLALCLKFFDISSSSSSLKLQSDVTELYCVPTCNLAKWHSSSRIRSMVQVVLLWFAKDNGLDLLAGVLWRTGDKLFLKLCNFQETSFPFQHPCEPFTCKHLSLPPQLDLRTRTFLQLALNIAKQNENRMISHSVYILRKKI